GGRSGRPPGCRRRPARSAGRPSCPTRYARSAARTTAARSSSLTEASPSRPPAVNSPSATDAMEAAVGVPIDPVLLERALTHRSYAYEKGGLPTNERLEF